MTEPPDGQMPKAWFGRHKMRTRDHVIPKCKNSEAFPVTVHSCYTCNQAKKNLSLEEFRSWCAMMLNKPAEQMVFYGETL